MSWSRERDCFWSTGFFVFLFFLRWSSKNLLSDCKLEFEAYLFSNLVLSRALFGVLFDFIFPILTRNIDMRMSNNSSDFIQNSKQQSLNPYHLTCIAAETISLQSILPSYLPILHKIILLLPCHLILYLRAKNSADVACDLQITCSFVPIWMVLDVVFLYSGLLSCPWMVATSLQGLKRPLFCQYKPTPSWSEARISTRVAVQLLNLQPHATGAGWVCSVS